MWQDWVIFKCFANKFTFKISPNICQLLWLFWKHQFWSIQKAVVYTFGATFDNFRQQFIPKSGHTVGNCSRVCCFKYFCRFAIQIIVWSPIFSSVQLQSRNQDDDDRFFAQLLTAHATNCQSNKQPKGTDHNDTENSLFCSHFCTSKNYNTKLSPCKRHCLKIITVLRIKFMHTLLLY